MARLPQPGADNGQWGQILNDYLSVSHASDGSLKGGTVGTTQLQDNSIPAAKLSTSTQTSLTKADTSVQSVNAVFPSTGNVTLTPTDIGADPAGSAATAQANAIATASADATTKANNAKTGAEATAQAALSDALALVGNRSVSASYAATITPNAATTDILNIGVLTGNVTIANPTGTPVDGQKMTIRLAQDSTGGRIVSVGAGTGSIVYGTDITAALHPTTASAKWEILIQWHAGDSRWRVKAIARGF
jgi:hypothetical protein